MQEGIRDEVELDESAFFPTLDPVDSMFNALGGSPQSSVAPLPPTPPPAHMLSPSASVRSAGVTSSPHPSPSAARRGCFGPRMNGYAYPLPRRARDEVSRVRSTASRGSASVPARLLQDPDVPALIELPGTLHGFSNRTTSLTGAGGNTPAAVAATIGLNPGALLAGVDYAAALGAHNGSMAGASMSMTGGGSGTRSTTRSKREPVPIQAVQQSAESSNWEEVTRAPLQLESDAEMFRVPEEWARRFRCALTLQERLDLLEELERLGKSYVERMKKARSDAYYTRMHAMRHLPAATKVTIRGRIHSKLNPFVKEKSAEVHKVIRNYLLQSIPFPPQ